MPNRRDFMKASAASLALWALAAGCMGKIFPLIR